MQDLTFTEDENIKVANFVNFVVQKAKWDITTIEANQLHEHIEFMKSHLKKIHDNILEIKKVSSIKDKK
jgi:hypothetical protein